MKTLSTVDGQAGELVRHIDAITRRFLQQARDKSPDEVALTRCEIRVLDAIGTRRSWTMGCLARHIVMTMSSLTAVVDRLVTKGMVERQRSEKDRRQVLVALTPKGRGLFRQALRGRRQLARSMLSALNNRERKIFLGLMAKIGGTAEADATGPVVACEPCEPA